ncbi:LamG-like jellyroll fold domain-containing protein [Portibacter marinus]|uniref:LamG-like jellyroll fold domain-containing protein n=1 Tax=Portibacter marinus TaxID=2898660 RepID=UPI001F2653B4|nr:LamG-like jellyroll fold domain-containing protein [Portibacter marinus]
MKTLLKCTWTLLITMLSLSSGVSQDVLVSYDFSGDLKDGTANENNLVITGTSLTTDRFGQARSAIHFDGDQDQAVAENSSQLNTPFTTVSFWVKMDELPGQGEIYLISYGGWQERFKVSLPAHGKPIWTTNSTNGISDMDSGDGNELSVGEWTHLAFTHDGVKDKIFINGVAVAEKEVTGELNNTSSPLGLGFDPMSGSNVLNGDLDEVVIFDTALDDAAILALYELQSTTPEYTEQLVASYPFDGNGKDVSGFENTATTNNVDYVPNRFGYGQSAVSLNGESTVTASASSHLNSPTTTVAFWVNVDQLPEEGEYYLMSHGGWQERWKISLPGHGKPVWTTNNDGGISDMDSGDGNELIPGQWMHLTMVHNGSKDQIYVNGILAAEKDVTGDMNSTTHPLGIGYNPIDNSNYSRASFDNVMIFNHALDAEAIEGLYIDQSTPPVLGIGMVADYHLNGNGLDESVYMNHAEPVTEITAVENRHGWGGNATSGALVAPNSPALQSENTSVSFWIRPNSFPESGEVFVLSHGGWQERWKISLPGHGKPVFTTNATNCCSDMDTGTPLELDTWTHLVMVHEGDKDLIYMNGELANEKESLGPLSKTGYPLGIGFDPIGGESFFDGALDDVKIFNIGLSAEEVAALYDLESTTPDIDGDLVAYYSFMGNSMDETPYDNHASSILLRDDRFGKSNMAALFTGSNSSTAANSPQLNSTTTTLSFWTYPEAYPEQGEVYLISHGGWQERFKVSLPSNGKVVWTTNNTSGISDMDSGEGGELPLQTWTHVAVVHDGVNDQIFFDGIKVAEKAVEGDLNVTNHPFGMGYNAVDGGNVFTGSLDEVQVYNRALSEAEILALFNEQSTESENEDSEAPCVPLDLAAEVAFTNVLLSWTAATDNVGVVGYNVYQDSIKTAITEDTELSISGLAPLTDYHFGVSAVDAAGNESDISSIFVTTLEDETPDTLAPTPPTNLVGAPSFNSVLLSWDAAIDDTKVNGYIVYLDGEYFDSLGSSALSVLVGGLNASELYTFGVSAFDLAGNVSETTEITVMTTEPLETAEPGLVAHYPFNNNAEDATPYMNHGNIGGDPTFEDATHPHGGTNIKFNGQDSILAPNGVHLLSDFTSIAFWIRVDSTNLSDAEAYVLDFGHWDERLKISLPQHLKIVFTTNSKNQQFDNFISDMDSGDGNEMVKSFWWHVTMVHDGDNDIIYVNGVEANKKPVNGILNNTARPLGIGNNPIDGGQFFLGGLDEVKIYNRALTPEEVTKLYDNNTVGVYDEIVIQKYVDKVFPNPAVDVLTITHGLPDKHDVTLNIYDGQGRQVGKQVVKRSIIAQGSLEVNVRNLKSGVYYMNFNYGGKNLGSLPFIKM